MFLQTRHPDCDNEGYWRHPVGAAPILLIADDAQLLTPASEQTLHHLAAEILCTIIIVCEADLETLMLFVS